MNSFSTANLALVAYALVESDGTSPDLNSGITTTKLDSGTYEMVLPGDPGQQAVLQEGQGGPFTEVPQYGGTEYAGVMRDLIFVSPILRGNVYSTMDGGFPYLIEQRSPFVIRVYFFMSRVSPLTAHDSAFSFMVLRSTINPPQDDSGNYIAPA
jgi:hypothetical protein